MEDLQKGLDRIRREFDSKGEALEAAIRSGATQEQLDDVLFSFVDEFTQTLQAMIFLVARQ
jgi:hypothetical protein